MRKHYERLVITPLDFSLEGPVLDGSYTNRAIKINSVEVDDFDNGFGTDVPFQDISFD